MPRQREGDQHRLDQAANTAVAQAWDQLTAQQQIDQLGEQRELQRGRVAMLEAERVEAGTRVVRLRDVIERARASASITQSETQRLQADLTAAETEYEQAVRTHGFAVEELQRIETERNELATRTAQARFDERFASHLTLCGETNEAVTRLFAELDPLLDRYLESAREVHKRERELKRPRLRTPEIQEQRFPRLTWRLNVLMQANGRVEAARQRERERSEENARRFTEALNNSVHRYNADQEARREPRGEGRADVG